MWHRIPNRAGLARTVLLICVVSLGINFFFFAKSRQGTYEVTLATEAPWTKNDPYRQEREESLSHQDMVNVSGPGRRPQQVSSSDNDTNGSPTSKESINQTETSNTSYPTCNLCPFDPPNLIGDLVTMPSEISPQELSTVFPVMENGGRYRPHDCVARQRLAVIIPYRNRWPHLHVLLHNLIPLFIRQQADVTFFVIEQDPPVTFNRGALLNVGFLEASKLGTFDCYIFHDVDLIPLNDHHMYRCGDQPRHFAVALNKYKYRLQYPKYFGGAVGFTRVQYLAVNGNSNAYFGWGGEDDDLYVRTEVKGYEVFRAPTKLARFDMINHTRDKGNEVNPIRKKILSVAHKRIDVEGLNTIKYKVSGIKFESLYTWINVQLNETQIFETVPRYLQKIMTEKYNHHHFHSKSHAVSNKKSGNVTTVRPVSGYQRS